jgi:hypothetical protein
MKNRQMTELQTAKTDRSLPFGPFGRLEFCRRGQNEGLAMKTEREILDEVRRVFPNAKYVRREPPLNLVAKECLVCGRVYYGRAESQYCGNKCASVGHRQYRNPRRTGIQSLRDQCRASWRRVIDRVEPQTFEEWLSHFEKFLERMCEMRREPRSISRDRPPDRSAGSIRDARHRAVRPVRKAEQFREA